MKRRGVIPWILAIVTLATFGGIVTQEFTGWDDAMTIFENPRIVSPSFSNVVYYWTNPADGLYVPVTYTMWSAIASVSRVDDGAGHVTLNPWAFHAVSIAIHVLSVLVVFQILRLLIDHEMAAMFGALLFAVHPMQVETVAWTSGAKDLLGGLFSLVAIWQYLLFAKRSSTGFQPVHSPPNEKMHGLNTRATRHFTFAAISLVIAMLSKPSAVTIPLIAGAIDLLVLRRSRRRVYSTILPLLLLTIPFIIVGRIVQTTPHVTDAPQWTRPLVALDALAFYAYKLIWPATLGIIYGRTPDAILKNGQIYFTWIVPVALFAIAFAMRKRWPPLLAGESIFFFAVLPVLGLTPFMFQVHSTVADHYVYVAMLGTALVASGAVRAKPSRSVYGVASVVIVLLAARSIVQAGTWRDGVTLASHAVEVDPGSATAHSNLGVALAASNHLNEAIPQLEAAVNLDGNNRDARTRLAQAYLQVGRYQEAYHHAQVAIDLIQSSPSNTIERADRARLIRDLALRKLAEQERPEQAATTQSNRPQ
jgi:hypothetical protein